MRLNGVEGLVAFGLVAGVVSAIFFNFTLGSIPLLSLIVLIVGRDLLRDEDPVPADELHYCYLMAGYELDLVTGKPVDRMES